MNREKFINELNKASDQLDKKKLRCIIEQELNLNDQDGSYQLVLAMEELSELIQQVSKVIRGSSNYYDLLQELADVTICIETIKRITKIETKELYKAVNVKVNRISEVIKNNGIYR